MKPRGDSDFSRQLDAADEEAGGRYSATRSRPTAITGTPSEPLPVANWSKEVVPQEPPLGIEIDVGDLNTINQGTPPWRERAEASTAQASPRVVPEAVSPIPAFVERRGDAPSEDQS